MDRDLIYDVGMIWGRTRSFLGKGFRVIAIEAHPALCAAAETKFAADLKSGQLVIVNKAVAPNAGPVTFYDHPGKSEWAPSAPNLPPAIVALECAAASSWSRARPCQHSRPPRHSYYLRVDIEGSDRLCFVALSAFESRPKYVSLETSKTSFGDLIGEFALLWSLGYRRFQIVRQGNVDRQRVPFPSREKGYVGRIKPGSSGLFGAELPGP
jgi:hypothetical protein